ncbi:prephenate dehydrogenase [Porifericola rhodea]|uniref:prephenate dehydrogenase n=1 Tax=Porifericola rhodea TaxID=930972 RepID=UPI002664FE28|nr:prephenate dehydrogenase [Porifericola rhodea]WKN33824.1 prephenate dehydrogenase [Porifericola rhodea]
MNICIVGLGLLGGSTALGLKAKDSSYRIIGVDNDREHAAQALVGEIADKIMSLEEAVQHADVVILATPVNVIIKQLPEVLDMVGRNVVVTDLGSTKEQICATVRDHPKRGQYVAAHPIAGTERSGPGAAFPELLLGKQMILCERDRSDIEALEIVENLFKLKLNMRVSYMEAAAHDRHIAYVSHLSHISSFALSTTVLDKEKDELSIFEMAGSGFSSTVRLAKSSAQMWVPIFSQNTKNISSALGSYIKNLQRFKDIIDAQDEEGASAEITRANDIIRVLSGIEK